jgi:hypothetical protein
MLRENGRASKADIAGKFEKERAAEASRRDYPIATVRQAKTKRAETNASWSGSRVPET